MSVPTLPLLELSEAEAGQVGALAAQISAGRYVLDLQDAYYNAEQIIRTLGISIPPQLAGLHTVMGWPQVVVDALEERLDVDAFRYPDATGNDGDLAEIWQANNLDEEAPLAHLDALIYGHSFIAVGSGSCGTGDCPPLITVESPCDMAVTWDTQARIVTAALRLYELDGQSAATLYLPMETLSLIRGETGSGDWVVFDRDVHRLGVVPVVRMANRQRTSDRIGRSEITPAVMSITDAACRTLLGMEVSREFFGAPQRYILGASESAFQDAAGNPKSAWETYIGRVLALERDEEGNVPQVGTFSAGDPSTYTKIIDMYARLMSGLAGLPPHFLGWTTDNPASADAIRSAEARLVKRAERRQQAFSGSWEEAMRLALLIRDGQVPEAARRLETVWREASTPTVAAQTDATVKLVQAGILPPDSDVALERAGFSAGERARIAAERRRAAGRQLLDSLANPAPPVPAPQAGVSDAPAGDGGPSAG